MKTERQRKPISRDATMPTILPNIPPGFNWGWHAREEPRMHLQVVDPPSSREGYKIWLERRGRRVFEPAWAIKSHVLKAIRSEVADHRQFVEDRWVRFMIGQGWLEAHLAAPLVTLVAYPTTPNKFTRIVDLTKYWIPEEVMKMNDADVTLSTKLASLQLWPQLSEDLRQDIRLSTILWRD